MEGRHYWWERLHLQQRIVNHPVFGDIILRRLLFTQSFFSCEDFSRRTIASSSRQLQVPSVATRPPRSGIHFDPPQICEHCHRPPHQVHGRTDVLPALRLEPYSAFLAAYRLSRISCPDALERSTTLDQDDPFAIPSGLSERPNVPPHLLPDVPTGERRARRLALLLDSDDQDIRDWAQAEYLKLGRAGRRLVREGVFEFKVALDGADDGKPPATGAPMRTRRTWRS
ncbi:hypothetical protein EI94DRAFT_1136349 [Lactarius quietus]|nr:hypothetical protein EI94DRAFT_1136349 [Lactarius quietus]